MIQMLMSGSHLPLLVSAIIDAWSATPTNAGVRQTLAIVIASCVGTPEFVEVTMTGPLTVKGVKT